MKKEKGPLLLLNLDKSRPPTDPGAPAAPASKESTGIPHPLEVQSFAPIEKRPWLLSDLWRLLLVVLSFVVAAGFVLILLPQPTVNKMTKDLEARYGTAGQEMISLLYLGDERKDNEFQIQGVIRNITTTPLEKLDAAVRLYAHNGNIMETTIIRMDKETIAPDEVAQFKLVYPNYKDEFMKYAVEFKLRDGGLVPYKDIRTNR